MKMNFIRFSIGFFLLFNFSCQDLSKNQKIVPDRARQFNHPTQISKPVVLMISIDGFRHDYLEKFKPPTLLAWAKEGVRADGIIPSFPTLTFPNHVSLVTGLRPGHHGIVGNKFYDEKRKEYYSMGNDAAVNDGSWYRGTPLWTAAEKEGMLSATCFWVGSEAKIGGVDPTYLKPYDGSVSNEQRVLWVNDWLSLPEETKPHFIGLYFSDVDSAGHKYGPDAPEVGQAVLEVDSQLGKLKSFIAKNNLDVQIIVVSDHGMKNIESTVDISAAVDIKKFQTSGRGAIVSFYSENTADIEKAYEDIKKIPGPFHVYKANEYLPRWGLDDADRKGDLIVVGDPGVYIGFSDGFSGTVGSSNKATHGWDTEATTDLNGLFIASGSKFKKGMRIKAFDNVHVYPMVQQILELKNQDKIDGRIEVLKPILVD